MKMNREQAFTIRFVLAWWHGASTRSETAVLQGRKALRNEMMGKLLKVEEHGAQGRHLCPLWAWRLARGWTEREGGKPTERGCRYIISVVCVCPQPNVIWLRLLQLRFSLPSAGLFPRPCVSWEREYPGAPGPHVVPHECAPALPGPVVLMVSYRFCHQVK